MILYRRSTFIIVAFAIYVCTFCFFFNIGSCDGGDYQFKIDKTIDAFNGNAGIVQEKMTMFIHILENNVKSVILNYLGIITFGISPVLSIFKSAGIFGVIFGFSTMKNGVYYSLAHTLPHSIELIPIILSAADGMYLGVNVGLNIVTAAKSKIDISSYSKRLCIYLLLIVLAAFLEVFVSMNL